MLALSCIFDRSAALTKSVGAEKLADTVCPTSTLRAITTPSIGDAITVLAMLTSAVCTSERACSTCASAARTWAAADLSSVSADSRSAAGSSCFDAS